MIVVDVKMLMVKDVNCWEYVVEVTGLETKKEKKMENRIVYTWVRKTSHCYHFIHQSHREVHRMPFLVSAVYTPVVFIYLQRSLCAC